ncbi:hypothetical protein HYV31_00680 [candidate division WWE3 bacterium]|nr:hypothetical protein [candidate division WWE3 bacterium]
MRKIPVILGPTSSGKTSIAVELSKKFSGRIVSADSRQVFKNMDVGTGKTPIGSAFEVQNLSTYWTLDDVPVFGYDLAFAGEYFSANDYLLWANNKLLELSSEDPSKNLFIVGGTGFYIDLLTGRIKTALVPPNFVLREELKSISLEELLVRLKNFSPEKYNQVDKQNKVRVMRAIEIAENLQVDNSVLTNHTEDSASNLENKFEFYYIGLTGRREVLYTRVDAWVEKVWENGLLEEVQNLKNLGLGGSLCMKGIVYKTVNDFLDGKIVKTDAQQRIKYDLHSYIRRQQTWFKRNPDIVWFDIEELDFFQKVTNHVQSILDG